MELLRAGPVERRRDAPCRNAEVLAVARTDAIVLYGVFGCGTSEECEDKVVYRGGSSTTLGVRVNTHATGFATLEG